MIIFYDTGTREIVGLSMIMNDTSNSVQEPTFKSSFPKNPPEGVGYYYTPNDATIANELWTYRLLFDSRGKPVSIERKPPRPYIRLSSDATDRDGNGVPEIIADGKAQCNITASVRDSNGDVLTSFDGMVTFRTTGGVLFDREVKCVNGEARTALRSVEETLTPRITAAAPGCITGGMDIEFVFETVFR